jgi:hypothetical protein
MKAANSRRFQLFSDLNCSEVSCFSGLGAIVFRCRQRLEQNFTPSQSRSHFLRHVKDRPQAAHILFGKSRLLMPFGIAAAARTGKSNPH